MKTIEVDSDLLSKAREETGIDSNERVLHASLKLLIRREEADKLLPHGATAVAPFVWTGISGF